jgi:hypothetical protein
LQVIFWQLIKTFLKPKIPLLKLSINWKVSKNLIKWSNMYKFIIKTFNQLKNDNFDQLIFGQTTPCPWLSSLKMFSFLIKKSNLFIYLVTLNIGDLNVNFLADGCNDFSSRFLPIHPPKRFSEFDLHLQIRNLETRRIGIHGWAQLLKATWKSVCVSTLNWQCLN